MTAFPYIPDPSTGFLAWRTRLDIEDSPMQKNIGLSAKVDVSKFIFEVLGFRGRHQLSFVMAVIEPNTIWSSNE